MTNGNSADLEQLNAIDHAQKILRAVKRYDLAALLADGGKGEAVYQMYYAEGGIWKDCSELEYNCQGTPWRRIVYTAPQDDKLPKGEAVYQVQTGDSWLDMTQEQYEQHSKTRPTRVLYTAPQAECAPLPKQEPLGEPFQTVLDENRWDLYGSSKSGVEPECAPRADSDVIEHDGQNIMQIWFECNRDVFVFYDRITAPRADEYREGTEHSRVLADLSAGEFKPLFPELQTHGRPNVDELRADAEKDAVLTDDEIRRIFMANGFTIKKGQTDLKPYVYAAARAILAKT